MDPATAVFAAMLDGWERQQHTRFLRDDTIADRLNLIRRLVRYSNLYPWQWDPDEAEAFICDLASGPKPIAFSTARGYQMSIRMFCDFVTDTRYGWAQTCLERFGQAPIQVMHELNSIVHKTEYEGRPERRPFTYDEIQALFDSADQRVDDLKAKRRKGVLTAMRDSAMLKTTYAYGLRRQEACWLDVADARHNPQIPDFGKFGAWFVRYGKASRGSPPKRRTVLTVPEMDWIIPVFDHYLVEVRPRIILHRHPALWASERGDRVRERRLDLIFAEVRDLAGLPAELDLHCLRHSYITHLTEFGYPPKFVQDQAGHAYPSTTAGYTDVSDEFRQQLLQEKMRSWPSSLWEPK